VDHQKILVARVDDSEFFRSVFFIACRNFPSIQTLIKIRILKGKVNGILSVNRLYVLLVPVNSYCNLLA